MATAVSTRPTAQHPKVKRPALSAAQPSHNISDQQSSSSPSASSKRLPPGLKQHSTTSNHGNVVNIGSAARQGNRRRDSQKQSEDATRQAKGGRAGTSDLNQGDKRAKRQPEPFVRTSSHILKKYSTRPPSFVLHLHPTHFRFDEQDGTFSYSSPMRVLLEHLKAQTVPHEMLEELVAAGIKFYDNCLIVQVHDHRNSSAKSQSASVTSNRDLNQPSSIHNYNGFVTPSSFVPYPHLRTSDSDDDPSSAAAPDTANKGERSLDGVHNESEERAAPSSGPRIFTTVLFPTTFSLQEELAKIANTPDTRSTGRRQGQSGARTSAASNLPPTPSSSSFVATSTAGPPAKKQKLMYNAKDLVEIEAKIVSATAPPLFLDPVDSLQEAQALMEKLQDPLLSLQPSAPKSRKRTVAELAADEALAAEEQRFMLIMDERLVPNTATSTTNKSAGGGGEAGNATFEARFERFKAIDEIRSLQQEKKQREQEAKIAYQQQQQKLKVEQQERDAAAAAAARQQAVQEQKARDGLNARRQEQMQQLQARQLHNQGQQMMQPQSSQSANQHAHPQTSATMMHTSQQLAASQPVQSSPIVGNLTPHNASSPHTTNGIISHGGQSIPMSTSNSNQGAGSPPRPGSAMQHQHPAVAMAAQRSQQPPSRNGTPAMPNGTPRIQQSTPIMRNVTPTPRMTHASPVNPSASTPAMNQFVAGTPHINGQQHMTPQQQQQQQMLFHQRQQALQQHMQGSAPNGQMPGQNLQQFAAQQYAAAAAAQRAGTEANYRQSLQSLTQQQMNNAQMGQQGFANGMSMHPIQMQQNMAHQSGNVQQNTKWQAMYQSAANQFLHRFRDQAIAAYGAQIPPLVMQQIRNQADTKARALVQAKRQQENAAQSTARQMMAHQMQANGSSMGGMGGMGGMNSM